MANITVTVNQANISVDEGNSNVAVTSTTSNVVVGDSLTTSNTQIRAAISVTDTGGDGSLAYNSSTGVLTFAGPSAAETRAHFSATSPVTLSSGVIGIDSSALFTGKTTDDLAQGTTNKYWSTSGAAVTTTALTEGTNLYFTNTRADARVNAVLPNTGSLSEGTNLYFTDARADARIDAYTDGFSNLTADVILTGSGTSNASFITKNLSFPGGGSNPNKQGQAIISGNGLIQSRGVGNDINDAQKFGGLFTSFLLSSQTDPRDAIGRLYLGGNAAYYSGIVEYGRDYLTSGGSSNLNPDNANYGAFSFKHPIGAGHPEDWTEYANIKMGQFNVGRANVSSSANLYRSNISTYLGTAGNGNVSTGYLHGDGSNIDLSGLSSNIVTTANVSIGGNLNVTGNINSETVVDLFVEDRNITMQYGVTGTPSANSQIFIDRGDASNTYIKWDESSDNWKFSNDGSAEYKIAASTSDLAEGTNLYYTNARADARVDAGFTAKSTTNLSEGTNLYFTNTRADARVDAGFTAKSTTNLSEGTNLYFTTARANTALVDSLDNITTAIDSTANISTTGTLDANTVVVGHGSADYLETQRLYGADSGGQANVLLIRSQGITGQSTNIEGSGELTLQRDGGSCPSTIVLSNATNAGGEVKMDAGNVTSAMGIELNRSGLGLKSNVTQSLNNASIRIWPQELTNGNIEIREAVTSNSSITTTANVSGAYIIGDGSALTNLPHPADAVTSVNIKTGAVVLTTADIAENTNLYYTDTRSRGAISTTTASASGGGALAYNNGSGAFTFTPPALRTDAEVRGLVSSTTASASGGGSLAYNNSSGVFTFAPADDTAGVVAIVNDTSTNATVYPVFSPASSGDNALKVSDSKMFFNPSTGDFNVGGKISAGELINATAVISTAGSSLQLKGQTGGIELDKTIASVNTRIADLDTTGYSVADMDFHTAAVVSDNTPALYTTQAITSGSATATAINMNAGNLYAIQEVQGGGYTGFGGFGQTTLQAATAALGANTKGWIPFQLGGSTTSLFPAGTFVVSIVGNTITYSQNAIASHTGGTIFFPGAFSTTQTLGFSIVRDNTQANVPFKAVIPWVNPYVLEETLANVTLDAVSYGDATANMANVVMRNMSDITSSPDSAVRIPRAMLIGANATPDLLSVGTTDVLPATTTLGVTVEQDGLTDFGAVDTTPQSKVMFNSYKTNSLASYTTYPAWSEFLGQSGNATVDMPYLGAPNFNFKLLGGTKAVKSATSSGDIPGRLTWNTLSVGGGSSGSDQFNPPASITGMVGGSGALATMANTDMHFQSTYNTSFRNGTDLAAGSIPRTFLSSTAGDVIIASKTDGNVSLRPVRDYGDTGSATTFVANRYAPNLHDYHEFITAGFLNQSTKAGTQVVLQNKSGQTGAAPGGSDFNYDSKGDVVLSFKTHNTNNSLKEEYTIALDHSTNAFQIKDNSASATDIELLGDRTKFGYRVNLVNLTTTEINALSSPSAGDFVYNETLAKLCFYNGSAWQKVTSDAM